MSYESLKNASLRAKLTVGWSEHVEYKDEYGTEHSAYIRQHSLLQQLREEIAQPRCIVSSGVKPSKAIHAPMPGKPDALFLVEEIEFAIKNNEPLQTLVNRARIMLGYEKPKVALAVPCFECGGTLIVASDALSDVLCTGCNKRFMKHELPRLFQRIQSLVDTMTAVLYIARPVGTLTRWATEGRITRHGGSRPGTARWDLGELPEAIPGLPLPPPPPLPTYHRA